MRKCSALILFACAFALLPAERVVAAPITWDFIATSCSDASVGPLVGFDPTQKYPLVLATLTLSGPDSEGSAVYVPLLGPPVLTGDPFVFDLVAAGPGRPVFSSDHPFGTAVEDYDLQWTETVGVLTSISVSLDGNFDSLGPRFGLTGGLVGSDRELAGCVNTQCEISGYWLNASLMTPPEPGSLALFASAFGV